MTEWINYHSHNRHLFVPPTEGGRPVTEADRIKELEARVAELERSSGGAGGTPPPTGPAYDPCPISTYLDNYFGKQSRARGGGGQG